MIKQAPKATTLFVIVAFVLSCLGLTLFLWMTFGGTTPLKPKGYRVQIAFTEATQLAPPVDVRVSGVTIGKVVSAHADPARNRTVASIELDRDYAPLSRSARAILRTKTLLGERYVELTLGRRGDARLPEGARLPDGQVQRTVELDELLSTFDRPTREAFQAWQQGAAIAVHGRGQTLNDAFGNLPGWASSATDLFSVLNQQKADVSRLILNSGVVLSAIAQQPNRLRTLMTSTDQVFAATSSQRRALTQTIRILPTFLDESRATLASVASFSTVADPVVRDLQSAAQDLPPTLRATRQLAPDLRTAFSRLDQLVDVSRTGLPALQETASALTPLLGELQPFLEQLNPALHWLEYVQPNIGDAIGSVSALTAWKVPGGAGGLPAHVVASMAKSGPDALMTGLQRTDHARGNAYVMPDSWTSLEYLRRQIIPSTDCNNTRKPGDGTYQTKLPDTDDHPSCWLQPPPPVPAGNTRRVPHIEAADYGG